MGWSIIWNVFARDFRKQRKRMFLTLLAVFWGTMSIMLLLAFGDGMREQFSKNINGMGEGIVVLWGGQTSIPFQGYGKGRRISLTFEDIDYLQSSMPELETVAGEYSQWGVPIKYKDRVVNGRINGVYPCYQQLRNFIPEMGGRMINDLDMTNRRRVVFLGDKAKSRLFGADFPIEEVVGKTVYIYTTPYTVVGVMKPKVQMSSYEGMDEDIFAIPATTFHATLGQERLDNIIFKPRDGLNFENIEKRLFEVMGARYRFSPDDDRALSTWDIVEERKIVMAIFIAIEVFLGVIGGLTLLVAGVGVANIMYVSIRERTREIGIKMAVGARRMHVLMQFIIEALGITFTGGLVGMAGAFLLTETFKRIPIESDALSFMGRPSVSMEIGLVVTVILALIGFLAGLFPAMKAASINPNEALRYE